MKTVFKVHRAGNNSLEKTDLESKHSGKRACEQLTKSPTKESLYLQARKEYEQNSLFYLPLPGALQKSQLPAMFLCSNDADAASAWKLPAW